MNFFTKIHDLIRQNEKIVKKPQKHDANLQKNSTLYFQVGLIICLLATNALFEMYFETQIPDSPIYEDNLDDEIFAAIPVIEKKPILVKAEPKTDIKPRRLIEPPVIVKNIIETPDEEAPDTELKPEDVNPIVPKASLPKVVDTKKNYNIFEVNPLPVFPGCEGIEDRDEQMKCFSEKINKLVKRKFDGYLIDELELKGNQSIQVQFTIDASGHVSEIKTRAKHPKLAKEAKRVINKIPQLQPGKYADTPVKVVFALPITLQGRN